MRITLDVNRESWPGYLCVCVCVCVTMEIFSNSISDIPLTDSPSLTTAMTTSEARTALLNV